MSHITCPKCGSNEHTSGYGLAAGPMGAYTFCNGCETLLEFFPDLEGAPPEQIQKIRANINQWRKEVWGDSSHD
jgi:hypothetical protein